MLGLGLDYDRIFLGVLNWKMYVKFSLDFYLDATVQHSVYLEQYFLKANKGNIWLQIPEITLFPTIIWNT